jgi:hypothetical protein
VRLVTIAFAALLPVIALGDCPANDPVEVARRMYLEHYSTSSVPVRAAELLSAELLALARREEDCPKDEECAFGADVWTGAQDGYVVGPPKVRLVHKSINSADVELVLYLADDAYAHTGKPIPVRLVLVRERQPPCWVIDDIRHREGKSWWSAKAAIRDFWAQQPNYLYGVPRERK